MEGAQETIETPSSFPVSPKKLILSTLAVIIVIAGIVLLLTRDRGTGSTAGDAPAGTREKVVVEKAVQTSGSTFKVPEGFPSGVPVEAGGIYQSYKASYTERGTAKYSVSYESSLTVSAKVLEYQNYMQSAGYTISTNTQFQSNGVTSISGKRDADSLYVSITDQAGKVIVRLNYLKKQ
jgi:hypothetical protein